MMKNFLKIAEGLDVRSLVQQLQRQPDLWNENTLRTQHEKSPHSDVNDIWVWFNIVDSQNPLMVVDDRDVIAYRAWKDLPAIRPMVFALMAQVDAVRLGRVIITSLPAGKIISPHIDAGAPATFYTRFQIALQCLPGNIFRIDSEEVSFRTGEVWQIDNTKIHSVSNNSNDDRIVCIVDLRCE